MAPKTFLPSVQTSWISRLTKDVRFDQTRNVANLDIVVSKRFLQEGEWIERSQFFQVAVWGEQRAERASHLKKGDMVVVTFSPADIAARIWGDANDKVSLQIKSASVSPLVKMNKAEDDADEEGAEADIPLEEVL